jgi:RNA polymerase sigma-70 factor (ECF subfamily)
MPEPVLESAYGAYRPAIRRHLARLVGESEAEDLAQEVFVKALDGVGRLRDAHGLRAWLYKVATNAALDRLRSRLRRGVQECFDEEAREAPGPGGGRAIALPVEEDAIRREMSACVRSIVAGLPVAQRIVLVLSEFEGLSAAEVAALLGISVGNVKIRLHRARARLRRELSRGCRRHRGAGRLSGGLRAADAGAGRPQAHGPPARDRPRSRKGKGTRHGRQRRGRSGALPVASDRSSEVGVPRRRERAGRCAVLTAFHSSTILEL